MYGIVANIQEPDKVFRQGCKAWIVGGAGGEGWSKFIWLGRTKKGKLVTKWTSTKKFRNFRCAWIPDWISNKYGDLFIQGSKAEIENLAMRMNFYFFNEV